MNITVFGAGNLGLACCAVLSQDNDVTLYTTRPHKSRETLAYTYEEKAVASATFTVTDDMARNFGLTDKEAFIEFYQS